MAIDSVDSFLAGLRRVQLLAPEQVDEIARELGPEYDDPRRLAQYLIQIDWLSEYQCRCLFDERWDALSVGHYQVLDRLGEGGVSEVFQAWDSLKGRVVALKVLRRDLASHQEGVRQFQRELQVVTRLSHPNVIKTFDAHEIGNVHCFAMEFVQGIDLHRYVATTGPLPVEQACDFARQTAQGLQHCHQLGLVHRDVKPANLFLVNPPLANPTPGGTTARRGDPLIKILDWGLARMLRAPGEPLTLPDDQADAEKGLLIGTADYVAPEQALDPTLVDTRADIYSLGCTLFFLLAGRPPFEAPALMQKLMQHQEAEPPRLRELRPDVPEELETLVLRMLAKKPEDRFQIPLLVVGPLRRFCPSAMSACGSIIRPTAASGLPAKPSTLPALGLPAAEAPKPSSSAVVARPASSAALNRPASSANLNRPASSASLNRPASSANLNRPASSANLNRPTR
jgi:serine/threonine protein kinase